MADTPENPPKKTWSSSDYRRRKAERDANRPASEQGQSGLYKAAKKMARDSQMVSNVFKQATDNLVKAQIEKARAEQARRKADIEEAFDNALKKSEDRARVGGSLKPTSSNSQLDEMQAILSEQDLWDFSYVEVGRSYSQRRWEYAWERLGKHKKGELIAGAIFASIAALITGVSWDSILRGVAAAVITLVGILIVLLLGYNGFMHPSQLTKRYREI